VRQCEGAQRGGLFQAPLVRSDDEDNVTLAALAAKSAAKPAPGSVKTVKHETQRPSKRPAEDTPKAAKKVKREKEHSKEHSKEPSKPKAEASKSRASASTKKASTSASKKYADLLTSKQGGRELDKAWPIKHQVVEAILCRWQHSGLPYPPPDLDMTVPSGFMAMAGVPGVFVGVEVRSAPRVVLRLDGGFIDAHSQEDVLGEILDRRPAEPRPSLNYLLSLRSETLAQMYRNGE
jgi:hypothetical protein